MTNYETIRTTAGTRLFEFLVEHRVPRAKQATVEVLITTSERLPTKIEQSIRESVREFGQPYPNVQVTIDFDTNPAATRFAVVCQFVSSGTVPGPPETTDEDVPWLLTIRFGSVRFEYLLYSRERWVPLLRPQDRTKSVDAVVIPRSMRAVPVGTLLHIWHVDGKIALHRTAERLDVTVLVNREWLTPDIDYIWVSDRGVIDFVTAEGQGTITYELTRWLTSDLSPGGAPDVGDGSPYRVELRTSADTAVLTIAPPDPADRAQDRRFAVPSGNRDGTDRDVAVQVLYSTATTLNRPEDAWHVKIYRCATPQHAIWLSAYLSDQATLIAQVNAQVPHNEGDNSYAIAPISVIRPGAAAGVAASTEYWVGEREIIEDPENRLSAWFGVTGQPQPDRFVIVISPLLDPVGWPLARHLEGPGVELLPQFAALARGLDTCHGWDVAHCDIKPANVCQVSARGRTSYVLIDGDSVTHLRGQLPALRFTPKYASAAMIERATAVRAPNSRPIPMTPGELKAHDRFGFVLLVLTAVMGEDRVDALLRPADNGQRLIDQPEAVAAALRGYWGGNWPQLVEELLVPFQPGILRLDNWSAGHWLARLWAVAEPARLPVLAPVSPPPSGRHHKLVLALREELRGTLIGFASREAIAERIHDYQWRLAKRTYRYTVIGFGVLPLVFVVLLAIVTIWVGL